MREVFPGPQPTATVTATVVLNPRPIRHPNASTRSQRNGAVVRVTRPDPFPWNACRGPEV